MLEFVNNISARGTVEDEAYHDRFGYCEVCVSCSRRRRCGRVGAAQRLRRGGVVGFFAALEPCLISIEACGGAHHWARELSALGHEVRRLPPAHVTPYVRLSWLSVYRAAPMRSSCNP